MATETLPKYLVDQVRLGQTVLFIGSGATMGAVHPRKEKPPLGQTLADLIAEQFLGSSFRGRALAEVSELAISESSLFEVQEFVADIFAPFQPARFHKLISGFLWAAIATTNYDLVVERAYDSKPAGLQKLVPIYKNQQRMDRHLQEPDTVPYFKLHGCIPVYSDCTLEQVATFSWNDRPLPALITQ